jgi:hypothetical protein
LSQIPHRGSGTKHRQAICDFRVIKQLDFRQREIEKQGAWNEIMGRPSIGYRAMTNAERKQRWRLKHFVEPELDRPMTREDLLAMIPTRADVAKWFGAEPENAN